MSFRDWYLPRGRLSRPDYVYRYVLPLAVLGTVGGITDSFLGFPPPAREGWSLWTYTGGPVSLCLLLAVLVPQVAALVARLHDRGHSARWLWWLLLPGVGWAVLVWQTVFLPGDPDGWPDPRPLVRGRPDPA
ncbi:hypothetical protein DQ237_17985 [Blastococcus sp. TF02-8]|uniref:DUF805 domain-containing protein n=1 Tax=Blastococcus sp. TF02-8 TaxID=2250574 RepID=UPI000DEAB9E3|nr:DUF805 domain-containing protein [Blastococcus sp. TF02-8]RBY93494.1 hypothetical protein DQ237_17985 [Blastococcus sp. TF02-8]